VNSSSAIADLQSRWRALCDLERARAVESMCQAGMSLRELASHLNCSASLLSYLLRAASAPAEDRELARSGEISTRELVRRAGPMMSRRNSTAREAVAFDREFAAVRASQQIAKWLDKEKITYCDRAKVIEQARLLNVHVDKIALGSLEAYLPDIPLDDVIRMFRPDGQEPDGDPSVAWYSEWLARWSLHGIQDGVVRSRALEIARCTLLICFTSNLAIEDGPC
jgi:transposase-like protein